MVDEPGTNDTPMVDELGTNGTPTTDKSVQWKEKSVSEISNSVLWERMFLKSRILSMLSVSFTCQGDGELPHPQVGAGIAVKWFLISLYNKEKSKSVETTAT